MKRIVPVIIATTVGWIVAAAFFIKPLRPWTAQIEEWFTILATMAFVLGGVSLSLSHLRKISDRKPGWGYSVVTLASFLITLVVGLLTIGPLPADLKNDSGESVEPTFLHHFLVHRYADPETVLSWLYEFVMKPITATMFALLAFYVASAAFRAFRAKNLEAGVLLVTAVVVLLGRTYIGTALTANVPPEYSALTFPGLTELIMGVCNTAGQRAIMIGIALGVAATSLRILLALDRPYAGGDED